MNILAEFTFEWHPRFEFSLCQKSEMTLDHSSFTIYHHDENRKSKKKFLMANDQFQLIQGSLTKVPSSHIFYQSNELQGPVFTRKCES
jgi:hypothetical protein